ncbi:Recombination protein O [Anaerohalosphaera lusitana]|uniref:DNA repair protein RecO n=1 Tax=Anaerohalosphaera lusitana TaxID=1936003 RepID=A0A1U9NIQ9_9BACT|nr:DNA repair protein RecO [Anaerohalosphaera lusitana]AQT67628.1 Recombination protein O [Anaerohalosphaera lusitana]
MRNKDIAICLRTVDYSETSQIATLFCREAGKISAIAKGSRRKKSSFDGPLEIFTYGDVIYTLPKQDGSLATLIELDQRPVFVGLRHRLYTMNCALFAAELTNKFTQDFDPHPDLFDNFVQFLQDLRTSEDETAAIRLLVIFQLTLLSDIGSGLILSRCANCSAPYSSTWPRIYFTSQAHGIVCPDCEISYPDKIRLSRTSAACISDLQKFKNADPDRVREIERLLVRHFTELLHKPPRMAKFFS